MEFSNDNQKRQNVSDRKVAKKSHEAIFMTLAKKSEKISVASYMVTDFLTKNDPLRTKIREVSLDLMGQVRELYGVVGADLYFLITKTTTKAWELVSLIEIASSTGLVTDMNSRLLKNAIVELIAGLRNKQQTEGFSSIDSVKIGEGYPGGFSLSKSIFNIENDEEIMFSKGQEEEKDVLYDVFVRDNNVNKNVFYEEYSTDNTVKFDNNFSTKKTENTSRNNERRDKILEIIRQKVEVSIKDITREIPDVSSKTIQRELSAMVDENLIKREGERRWAKYSIK